MNSGESSQLNNFGEFLSQDFLAEDQEIDGFGCLNTPLPHVVRIPGWHLIYAVLYVRRPQMR